MGTDRKSIVPGNLGIIGMLNEVWPIKGFDHCFTTLRVFNTEKGHHHCLKVFNTEKGLYHFLKTFKVFSFEKGLHHFPETLKGFNFEKWLPHILKTQKVFQTSYSVECWRTAAFKGRLSYILINELDLLWLPHFIALGIYFFYGNKFSWNEGIDTCFNVEYVLLDHNFHFLGGYLVVTACYLVVTTGYCPLPGGYCSLLVVTACYRSLLLVSTFSMNTFLTLSVSENIKSSIDVFVTMSE